MEGMSSYLSILSSQLVNEPELDMTRKRWNQVLFTAVAAPAVIAVGVWVSVGAASATAIVFAIAYALETRSDG
jgi:hypothetical protein